MPGAVELRVELGAGTLFTQGAVTWTDITDYVEGDDALSITYGRGDGFATVDASGLSLTLDNRSGVFTPPGTGAVSGLVAVGTLIRVRARYPAATGTWYARFFGAVDEWEFSLDGAPTAARVQVTASSMMARLGRNAAAGSVIEQEVWYSDTQPVAYYPLTEAADATVASDASIYGQAALSVTQLGSGGTLTFASGTGPGTDGASAPTFTRASSGNGKFLRASYPVAVENPPYPAVVGYRLEAWFNTTSSTALQTILEVGTIGGDTIALYLTSAGKLAARYGTAAYVTGTTTVTAAATHLASVYMSLSPGGSLSISLYLDGALEGTAAAGGVPALALQVVAVGGPATIRSVGDAVAPCDVFNGVIAHAAVWVSSTNGPGLSRRYDAGTTGCAGETTASRVSRLARWAGVPWVTADPAADATLGPIDSAGQPVVDLLTATAVSEGGLLFDSRSGELVLQSRDARANPVADVTLSATAQEIETSLSPKLGDAQLVTGVTVSWAGSPAVSLVDTAAEATYGQYRQSLDTTLDSEVQALDLASFRLRHFSTPSLRVASVGVDLLNAGANVPALLALDLSDVISLTNLPVQAFPTTSALLFVEGYTETISGTSWTIALNTASADGYQAWILDNAIYSVLDSTTYI